MQNKIYYNLKESPYIYYDENHAIYFYFSSPVYLEKFEKNLENYVKSEVSKFVSKYSVYNMYLNRLMTIAFYKKIEKRGCYYEEK